MNKALIVDMVRELNMDNDLKIAVEVYLEAIKASYFAWGAGKVRDEIAHQVRMDMLADFNAAICYEEGSKYIRIVTGNKTSRSVHSFIAKGDATWRVGKKIVQIKRGDILKAATWKAPAKNQARGNIFQQYHTQWEGADYLR